MNRFFSTSLIAVFLLAAPISAQEKKSGDKTVNKKQQQTAPGKKKKRRKKRGPVPPNLVAAMLKTPALSLARSEHQIDFPAMAADLFGNVWITCIDHTNNADTLKLARKGVADGSALKFIATIGEPGIIHHPAIAVDGNNTVWCFWGQTDDDDVVHLRAQSFRDGKPGRNQTLTAKFGGSDSFADAGTDSNGRVWVVWQSFRSGKGDIFAKNYDPKSGKWSGEIAVAASASGEWEPRVAFDREGNAWVIFDSSEGNEFNLYLTKVNADGKVGTFPIAHSPRYEARADIAATNDGTGFWIAAERGRVRWGLDVRGHGNQKGLNAQKDILFGRFDLETSTFTEIDPGRAGRAGAPVNLPAVGIDANGDPWLAYRYFERVLWRIAVTRYDQKTKTWSSSRRIPGSSFGQDRRSNFLTNKGKLWLSWPSDLRNTKASRNAGVYLAALETAPGKMPPPAKISKSPNPRGKLDEPFSPSQKTPERPADDRHFLKINGEKYGLYWGDLHRHTDVSNCRTGFDGCIAEHFRYARDIAKLDFLGTSDHTDIGKIYSPYEWWHNQRMHDVFHVPGKFNTLYVYEREQRWPWGHRNVIFAQRGGPVVYINRVNYRNSLWQKQFPVKAGLGEINPPELWDILDRYGKPVALISHTGATGMGTDWGRYDRIDYDVETLVEIFQGARVSYEGIGTPQPTVGLRPGEPYTANSDGVQPPPPAAIDDFGKYNPGVYQNALEMGRKLGVFASSDHISQHVSYGGVYCKDYTREGIIEGFLARRTIAATDKIYVDFTCNGNPMGSIFKAGETKPGLQFKVDGTADLKRVTIVRNEKNWKVFDTINGNIFEKKVKDDSPLKGENRYYIRVEQKDGNMAWSSPVWVEIE